MFKVKRSSDVKDVIFIKVKKYSGYFNPETRSFAVDPHLTTFQDLQKILVEAFNLNGPFHITYLCRDDAGENIFLSMLTDWDLDAAFLTSSDPHLRLKLDAEPYKDGLMSKFRDWEPPDSPSSIFTGNTTLIKNFINPVANSVNTILSMQNPQKTWINSLGGAFSKLTTGWSYNTSSQDECKFFPSMEHLDDAEFRTYLDDTGKLTRPEDLRLRVYHGGVAPALRKVVWRMLLNIFPSHLNGKERFAFIKRKSDEYKQLRSKWQAEVDSDNVKQISNMVWKDVLRTDRSHAFYEGPDDNPNTISLMNILTTYALSHPSVCYCQGMSDLVSPIFMVMNNEAQTYICFCALMIRLRVNFLTDGIAMSIKFKHLAMLVNHYDAEFFNYLKSLGADNMFFCYRWILLEMKREFSIDDAISVLEVMWSSLPPQPPENDLPLVEPSSTVVVSSDMSDKEEAKFSNNIEKFQTNVESTSVAQACAESKMGETSPNSSKSFSSLDSLPDCEPLLVNSPTGDVSATGDLTDAFDHVTMKRRFHRGSNKTMKDGYVQLDTSETCVDIQNPPLQQKSSHSDEEKETFLSNNVPVKLPPPEEFGCGNPFLLFVCLAVLLDERDALIGNLKEFDDMVMHFDRKVRKHKPRKVLSRAMKLFAEYLRNDANQL